MNGASVKTLIIKIGATGDVVRTTALLRVLEGEIHWLTAAYNIPILPLDCPGLTRVFSIEKDIPALIQQQYDLVLSLDEETAIAAILPLLTYTQIAGVCMTEKGVGYTGQARGWFDMSLLSELGKQEADMLKWRNRKSYQHLIFEAAGKVFNGERYWINLPATVKNPFLIGIEPRTGSRWKGKQWWGYNLLAKQLEDAGFRVFFFKERSTLQEYITDIGSCSCIVTGDTLAMHVALALGLPTLSVFTCTSPWEIYEYGLLYKVISPVLEQAFYQNEPVAAAIEAISVDMVMQVCMQMNGAGLNKVGV